MSDDREQEQIRAVLDAIVADEAGADLAPQVKGNSITVAKFGTN